MRLRRSEPGRRLFFATDIHGSERCFRKWLNAREAYDADALILGGDITGKALVPIVAAGSDLWIAEVRGEKRVAEGEEELAALRQAVEMIGYYALVLEPDEKAALDADPVERERVFRRVMRETLERWMRLADERLPEGYPAFAMLGNDDYPELERAIEDSRSIVYSEGRICELPGGAEILSCGYSNPTPWDSPRELVEDELGAVIEAAAAELRDPGAAVFNLHCPPYDTGLDQAPVIDAEFKPKAGMAGGVEVGPVGSTAVRAAIEKSQPMVSLHGHVHECSAGEKLGRTLCVNPGSNYLMGTLKGALVEFDGDGRMRGWQMTEG